MSLVGRLEDLALPDIFQIINLSKKTGTLVVRSEKGTGIIVFQNGKVVQAATDAVVETLGSILLAARVTTEEMLAEALARQKETGRLLGRILVEMGALSPETLAYIVRRQIEEIVFLLLTWTEGFFDFELGAVDLKDQIKFNTEEFLLESGLDPQYLIMEGTRRLDERMHGEGAAVPVRAPISEGVPVPTLASPSRGPTTAGWTGAEGARLASLKSMFQELRFPSATAEVSLLILRVASEVVNRAVLFLVRGSEVVGLGAFGVELSDGEPGDERVRRIRIPLREDSIFAYVVERKQAFKGALRVNVRNAYLVDALGGMTPSEVLVIPMLCDGKVALILYGDNLPADGPIGSTEAMEIFVGQAGLAMEKALLERRIADLKRRIGSGTPPEEEKSANRRAGESVNGKGADERS